ncbi:multisubunit Na+/H+ antiporter, MnhF subunit [Rhizobium leguminosarum bv. trifolii WSM2297]|uniref:Multisubunit Na+/H+ antiporter, MnhF subunit n=1 Tax=Rhizobium leguminosarum bv. trifolii WSM2297 TaxID=754762 RepID=J0KM99_RHILT|nr:cation:proton antiporter [Rhizobium leguminosarum]EJC78489.1 multisubunit Na+/H+ antiporter, MnhF subunit [Rhizobium leguminosarum bv. trifolii WSM2297]
MITPAAIVAVASSAAAIILGLALILTVWRVVVGPTLPDRILALDMLTGIAIGLIAVIAVKTGFSLYIDIAISLGLVGFLATVAFARFVLSRGNIKSPASASPAKANSSAKANAKRPHAGGKKR